MHNHLAANFAFSDNSKEAQDEIRRWTKKFREEDEEEREKAREKERRGGEGKANDEGVTRT